VDITSEPVYEARYGFDRSTAGASAVALLFTVVLLAVPEDEVPLPVRVLGLLLFGGGGLLLLLGALTRKVALRVDSSGILLGGTPVRYRATTVLVPWEDVRAVFLWRQQAGPASLPWVGLARRPGAPRLPGPGQGPGAARVMESLMPAWVPGEVGQAGRAVNGWRLDRDRFTAALAHFAPDVPVEGGH
jgi:hypothetical protein